MTFKLHTGGLILMSNFEILTNKFPNVRIEGNKVFADNLIEVLEFLKNTSEFDFDMLTSIVAIDLESQIQLIYQLFSSKNNEALEVVYNVQNGAPTVTSVYKSAYFEECEIYDLFGVDFDGNENLKRLFMPESWIGHPLLKSYKMSDERLVWND